MTSLLITGGAVVVTGILGFLTVRRAAYERVMRALDFVSEGPVASARHRLGSLVYDYADSIRSGERIMTASEEAKQRSRRIEDLFTVFWAATRLNAVRESLGPSVFSRTPIARRIFPGGPHRLLEESVSGWVKYWMQSGPAAAVDTSEITRVQAVALCLGATVDADDLAGLRQLEKAWTSAHG